MTKLLTIVTLFILISCSNNKEIKKENDYSGEIQNNKYINEYFGFSLEIPSDWRVVPNDEYQERNQITRDEVSKKVNNIEDNDEFFKSILVIEKDPTADSLYSYIVFMTEDKSKLNQNAKQYLEYAEKFINEDKPEQYPIYEFGPIKTQSTIGGKDFLARPSFIWTSQDSKRVNMTYCKEFPDYLLVVLIGGVNNKADIKNAQELLNKIKWSK